MTICGVCKKRKVAKWFGSEGTRCKTCIREAVRKVMSEDRKVNKVGIY